MRKCPAALAIATALLVLTLSSSYARAQFMSHNFRGDFGVLAGTQPPPGWWVAAGYVRFDTDTLRDDDGNSITIDPLERGSISANGYAAGFWRVTEKKIFGGNYSFMAFPAWTDNKVEAPILGLAQETGTGFTDLYFQPINLGWHRERADYIAAIGVVAPTGSYDPDAPDNLGLGMWSFELSGGATWYLDAAKSWHFATAAFYETHTTKKDTDIRVGDILTIEGGFGKSFMEGALTVGVAFDAQWKITEDDPGELQPVFDMLNVGRHRVYGVGVEATLPIATKKKLIGFLTGRYMVDVEARNTFEGTSFVLLATFPVPSVSLE